MKKCVLIIFFSFFIFTLQCVGQQTKIDSLLVLLKTDKPDTNKVKHLNSLSWLFRYQNTDTAIVLGKQALELITPVSSSEFNSSVAGIEEKGIELIRARIFVNLGVYFSIQSDDQQSLYYLRKALEINERHNNKKGLASSLTNIGIVYHDQGQYPQALDYYFKALKINEELGDKNGIAGDLNNIGNVYRIQKGHSHALVYYFKALNMVEDLGLKSEISMVCGNIGVVKLEQDNYQEALDYMFKALKIDEELGSKYGIAFDLGVIGAIYSAQKDYVKSLDSYFKALNIAEVLGDKSREADVLGFIGQLYMETGKFKEAEHYLQKAIDINNSIGSINETRQLEESLSKLYDTTGRFEEALIHYKKAMSLKDTLFSQENKKQLVQKEMNYEFDKKEAATKAAHDKEIAVAETEKKKQQIVLLLVSCVLLLAFLFAGFVFRSLRIARKQKHTIESQKFQIVESINYSKKIQNSLLPTISDIQKSISGFFVFYQPKDIVSGDFYYFREFESHTLLACVDCTGHGVSGGFMSTLGSLLLDKIVNSELLSPSEILTKLSDEVIRVLHQQSEGEIQDGMDLSICLIDHASKKIQFSGARNGIIVVSQGQSKRYKADILPVGGNYIKKGIPIVRKFNTQSIEVNQNDWVYMYTDGFMEQTGGDEGIPMNYSQFENNLINLSNYKSQEEKNQYLKSSIDAWRGKRDKDDDILIMGFQVA